MKETKSKLIILLYIYLETSFESVSLSLGFLLSKKTNGNKKVIKKTKKLHHYREDIGGFLEQRWEEEEVVKKHTNRC